MYIITTSRFSNHFKVLYKQNYIYQNLFGKHLAIYALYCQQSRLVIAWILFVVHLFYFFFLSSIKCYDENVGDEVQ